jgi:hypothetical protein
VQIALTELHASNRAALGCTLCRKAILLALLFVFRYAAPALGFFSQPSPALRHFQEYGGFGPTSKLLRKSKAFGGVPPTVLRLRHYVTRP